jgi:hypothetical protein
MRHSSIWKTIQSTKEPQSTISISFLISIAQIIFRVWQKPCCTVLTRYFLSQRLGKAKQKDGKTGFQTRLGFNHWRQGGGDKQDHYSKSLVAVVLRKVDASFLSTVKSSACSTWQKGSSPWKSSWFLLTPSQFLTIVHVEVETIHLFIKCTLEKKSEVYEVHIKTEGNNEQHASCFASSWGKPAWGLRLFKIIHGSQEAVK